MIQFRSHDASPDELRAACVDNHLVWLRRLTYACQGQLQVTGRLEWAVTWHPMSEATIAVVDPPEPAMRGDLDEIINTCRANGVERLGCWAADESYAAQLGPWLEARGLRRGDQPHWMALDLHTLPEPPSVEELASTVEVTFPDRFDDWTVAELLCYGPDTWRSRQQMVSQRPQRVWHSVMWQDGSPVGQLSFNATEGQLGVIGLHNFLILPQARTRGLGLDRFDRVSRFSLDLGCRYLVANALRQAVPLYRTMNFQDVGRGQTWWATRVALDERPPQWQVHLAEAVGAGDLDSLRSAVEAMPADRLDQLLPNGVTPLQYAAHAGQPAAARFLISRGATPDVLAAWDLGWRDEARQLLSRDAAAVLARRPRSGKTLLHVAVERDDPELVEMLLAAGADPAARDHRFQATPFEFAKALRHRRTTAVLRDRAAAQDGA